MAEVSWNLQKMIYAILTGSPPALKVHDDVPDSESPDSSFPYVNIGEMTDEDWSADDFVGREMRLNVHTWSRYDGMRELKILMDAVKAALNRREDDMELEGAEVILCEQEFSGTMLDPDGRTRHGVQRFRFLIKES